MTYLLFFKILKEKLLDFKVKGGMKSVLKWCLKKKKYKKPTQEIVCEAINFSSTKLTKHYNKIYF